jgi:hypothetical protein
MKQRIKIRIWDIIYGTYTEYQTYSEDRAVRYAKAKRLVGFNVNIW